MTQVVTYVIRCALHKHSEVHARRNPSLEHSPLVDTRMRSASARRSLLSSVLAVDNARGSTFFRTWFRDKVLRSFDIAPRELDFGVRKQPRNAALRLFRTKPRQKSSIRPSRDERDSSLMHIDIFRRCDALRRVTVLCVCILVGTNRLGTDLCCTQCRS